MFIEHTALHSAIMAQTSDETEKASVWFVVASQKLTVCPRRIARGREMGELPGASLGGFACPTIGDRQKVKVYGLRRWQQHQQGLIRQETIRLAAAAAAAADKQPFFQLRNYIRTQPSLETVD